ncbi:hypothetical protein DPMN_039885 [Dreissena polymorpha]|uniref:Uncharacterized protein n=1 Tax=Dreissena polymorpha TaxID=45954 RepID=A0A9D4CU70_DREPO|nr:hypothetical protein DPMN_039885 [Dreissena polymorpha]
MYPSQLQTSALDDIIGVLSDPDMIEKQSSVRKQQTETAGKVVLDNMSKAKKT